MFHVPAGASSAVEVPIDRLDEIRAAGGWLWLDVTEFDADEVWTVGETFGFEPLTIEDVLDWSKFPKVEEFPAFTFVVGHALSVAEERVVTVEYDVFVSERFLVTFHREDLPSFVWGREHAVQAGVLAESGPDVLWARIAEVGAARFLPIVEGLEETIADLEDRAIAADPSVPAEVLGLRRDVQTLRQVAGSQRDVFRLLGRDHYAGIRGAARRRLSHVHDDYGRLTEMLEGARLLLTSVLETYRGTVAERTNDVMKVLTVFAAIVLPLSLIAGIYGMNFTNMPELDWRWGYFFMLGVMAVVGFALWAYFGRRGFVGGPRVTAVPGLVGKGLVELVKLTARPATLLFDLRRRNGPER